MDTKLTHQKLIAALENSNKILIALSTLSAFGLLYGLTVYILDNIWINIPNNYPTLIISASSILLAISYMIYRNTKQLTKTVRAVKIEI